MIQALIILLYVLGLSAFVYRSPFFCLKGIGPFKLTALFLFKVVAAILYVYVSKHIIEAGDIVQYYADSKVVYAHLLNGEWSSYWQLTFGINNGLITENIAESVHAMGYWYDTSAYMIVRFNALVNILTFGSGIYANAVFFAFLSFCASVLLARLLEDKLGVNVLVKYVIFLTPSLWYWTSGMHKEAASVFLVSLILFSFLRPAKTKVIGRVFIGILAFILLFYTRFFIAIMLLPPLLAYGIYSWKRAWSPMLVYVVLFIFIGGMGYAIPKFTHQANIVDAVLSKKALYESLDNGNTAIELGVYEESYVGLVKLVPQALFNTMLRPHFFDIKSVFLGLASGESLLISLLFVGSLFFIKTCTKDEQAFVFLLLSFALSYLIITGLIVPNIGAILRYRSVALFFLVPCSVYLLSRKTMKSREN